EGGRPRRDLHADVSGSCGRVTRVRARRGRAGADLLRIRGARGRVAPGGLGGEGRRLCRLVAATREARRDARDARPGAWNYGRARTRVEPRDGFVAGARDAPTRNHGPARGPGGGAVSAR